MKLFNLFFTLVNISNFFIAFVKAIDGGDGDISISSLHPIVSFLFKKAYFYSFRKSYWWRSDINIIYIYAAPIVSFLFKKANFYSFRKSYWWKSSINIIYIYAAPYS